jgi:hypothetical protein
VSHDLQAVSHLCQRALFLNHRVVAEGPTGDVIHAYVTSSAAGAPSAPQDLQVTSSALVDADGALVEGMVQAGQHLQLHLQGAMATAPVDPVLRLQLVRSTDNVLIDETALAPGRPPFDICVSFQANLVRGHYHVAAAAGSRDSSLPSGGSPVVSFAVDEHDSWSGFVDLAVRPGLSALADEGGRL